MITALILLATLLLICQDTGPLGHLGTLLAHGQPVVDQHPQVLFCKATFQALCPKTVVLQKVVVTQVQDPVLDLTEPHPIGLSPSIQPSQAPLQSLPTLQQINTPAQLGVVCKLMEGALNPLVQVTDKDIKQSRSQFLQKNAVGNDIKGFYQCLDRQYPLPFHHLLIR
ncbi:hypothetical protein BTVI_42994 [Pitangus sulphuratus]|nr:hypothetical protein BTVI_42994 [Pitangus sulphuratus]